MPSYLWRTVWTDEWLFFRWEGPIWLNTKVCQFDYTLRFVNLIKMTIFLWRIKLIIICIGRTRFTWTVQFSINFILHDTRGINWTPLNIWEYSSCNKLYNKLNWDHSHWKLICHFQLCTFYRYLIRRND